MNDPRKIVESDAEVIQTEADIEYWEAVFDHSLSFAENHGRSTVEAACEILDSMHDGLPLYSELSLWLEANQLGPYELK